MLPTLFSEALDRGGKADVAMLSVTCAERFAPGIAQVMAGISRIQRKENGASDAPDGTSFFKCSTALRPVTKSTPEKVSPRSNASPCRLKFRWSSFANLLERDIFPDNRPDAKGTRARIPTLRFWASAKNRS